MVNNSTFASEIRTSPAITNPLSRMRSRMSSRFAVPETVGTRSIFVFYSRTRAEQHRPCGLNPYLCDVELIAKLEIVLAS